MNRVSVLEKQSHCHRYQPSIVVMGSCFLDYVAYVDHMPVGGETMHSKSFSKGFGGKGANQAIAASRVGASVAMVGMVGRDGDGESYLKNLKTSGIDTTYTFSHSGESSGLALIFVDVNTSQNEIVICPNATLKLTPEFLKSRTENFTAIFPSSVKVLICQNEVPLQTTLDTLKAANQKGIYTIYNAAPAPTLKEIEIIKPYLKYVSLFCPNEVEAANLTGVTVDSAAAAEKAASVLQGLGVKDVVITLGGSGFLLAESGKKAVHVAAEKVKPLDTTGAGDCFVGCLAAFFVKGHPLLESCRFANKCAAFSVTRKGTQSSYPSSEDMKRLLSQ